MATKGIRNFFAFIMAAFMALSLAFPMPTVHAAEEKTEEIEKFTASVARGAKLTDGKYIWTPVSDADNHKYVFKVSYAFSGQKDLAAENVQITIPKTILKDRDGKSADYTELSVPYKDDASSSAEYAWKNSDDGKSIIIYNVKEVPAGESGYFEIAYVTNEQTFEYKDMSMSAPFQAKISVRNGETTETAQTDAYTVGINTAAEISSTEKRTPEKIYRTWQSSWGTQPSGTSGHYFMIWEIVSKIKADPTQPYSFTLKDTPGDNLNVIGYKMSENGDTYTDKATVTDQRTDSTRHDYVLTSYDPSKVGESYDFKNSIKATVTPSDGIDRPTIAEADAKYKAAKQKMVHPTGSFYGKKYGNSNWYSGFKKYWDYASYDLDQLQNGKINSIDSFKYFISTYGYPAPWTRDGDADDPSSYGKKKVTYVLSDDELYLDDDITSTSKDEELTYDTSKARRLTSDDYQFLYADWSLFSEFKKYSSDTNEFEEDPSGAYSSNDIVHFYAKTGSNGYKEVGTYNMGTKKATIADSGIVASLDKNTIKFKENANVTGIKFTTSNAYWYTHIIAYPMVRLKNSQYVMNKLKDESTTRLQNFSQSVVLDSEGNELLNLRNYAFDRATGSQKSSEIHKHIISTGNDINSRSYTLRWKITQGETIRTDENTEYIAQKSGKFYDLLPKGLHLQKESISVETEEGKLSSSSFEYSVKQNYKGSGRDMVIVTIPQEAKYYNLYLSATISWDGIKDYGGAVNNPIAYETGNDEITDGSPDDGGKLTDVNKKYLTGLDPDSTANKFIYDEEAYEIDAVTAASSGLRKQVMAENDTSYSYDTFTTPSGSYSYRLRFSNASANEAENLVFFDSLENYTVNGKSSEWHGTLKDIDLSQLKEKGISPVVYISTKENLSFEDASGKSAAPNLTGTSVWTKVTDSTDLSKAKAVAVDCRKATDGKSFNLKEGESITAVLYMQAPDSVNETSGKYAEAYNNIYILEKLKSATTSEPFMIHQDYTTIKYKAAANIKIHKQSSQDADTSVPGARYTLKGTSDYGTKVDQTEETGSQGNAVFKDIEKGTYNLKETYSPSDWQTDTHKYKVAVSASGKVTIDDSKASDSGYFIVKDSPRIHGNISFVKYKVTGNTAVSGATFCLSGTSKYGNEIIKYATSGASGKVTFEDVEYGNYKLKEVKAPNGYVLDSTVYDASVSEDGEGGISDTEMLKSGKAVIRNEEYHTIKISKQSSSNDALLSGAEFRMSGTSSRGNGYDKTAVSGTDGIVKFTDVEAGTYVLQEVKAPNGYTADTEKRTVIVNSDGTYTISGLSKNENKIYRENNSPSEKTIIVRKVWKDNLTNDKRPVPNIHITTDVSKVPSYAVWRSDVTSPLSKVTANYKTAVTSVAYASDVKSESDVPAGAVRLDKDSSNQNASVKIYGWLDSGTLYYWTNAQTTRMTDGSHEMFRGMSKVQTIDLSHISTTGMTTYNAMFADCSSLKLLDLSGLDSSKVTNMGGMFNNAKSLEKVNMEGLDTSHVTKMGYMFAVCGALKDIEGLSKFNTESVTDMQLMFNGCSSLTVLDLSSFNTEKVENMANMFNGCSSLNKLTLSNKFDTKNVINMQAMFYMCKSLQALDLSSFDTSNVTNMIAMFTYCSALKTINGIDKFDTTNVVAMNSMFALCSSLESLDVSGFKTENATNMNSMFLGCSSLKSLDVSGFKTGNVTAMNSMFSVCSSLESLDVSGFKTEKVTNMDSMFNGCKKITELNVSGFVTENVTNMASMFSRCSSLNSLDVSGFKTEKVTNMASMFNGCEKITELNISGFVTKNVTNMTGMFAECRQLKELDLTNFNTANVTDMGGMFNMDSKLAEVNVTSFNTSNVTNMAYMFDSCFDLLSVDLSSFNTAKVTNMDAMFANDNLKKIYISKLWNTDAVTSSKEMFANCTNLPNYNPSVVDKTKANSDGYMTLKTTASVSSTFSGFASYIAKSIMFVLATPVHAESIVYDSSDASKCTVAKNDNEWIYKFTVSDDSSEYYAWEDDLAGYTSNHTTEMPGKVTKDSPLTITNTSSDYTAPGSLSLTKKVAGTDAYKNAEFLFTVKLSGNDTALSGTKIFGDTVFTDGTAEVTLKQDETVTFSNIPAGVAYSITEATNDKFTSSSENASGTITSGKTAASVFTNTPKTAVPDTSGELTLTKKLTGNYQNDTNKYTFNISFRNLAPDTSYGSGKTAFTSDQDGNGFVSLTLSKDEYIKFSSLSSSAEYKITESAGDYEPSFNITGSGNINQAQNSADKNEDLSTKWESCGSNDSVVFTNTIKKYQSITLKKTVTGGEASSKFHFVINFTNLTEAISSTETGEITPDENDSASADVYLSAGDSMKFSNVPVNTKYTVTEKANAGTASYTVTFDKNGTKTEKIGKNHASETNLATSEITVNEDENAEISFVNDMPKSADVSLTKKVSGLYADRSHYFRFTVSLTGASKSQKYSIDLSEGSGEHDGKSNPLFITTNENGNGSAEIYLKNSDKIVIKKLPATAKYSIAEDAEDYSQSITLNGSSVTEVSEQGVSNADIVFTNTKDGMLPTGRSTRYGVAIACAAIIMLIMVLGAVFRYGHLKKKKAE